MLRRAQWFSDVRWLSGVVLSSVSDGQWRMAVFVHAGTLCVLRKREQARERVVRWGRERGPLGAYL